MYDNNMIPLVPLVPAKPASKIKDGGRRESWANKDFTLLYLPMAGVKGQGALPHAVRVLGRDVKTRERKLQSGGGGVVPLSIALVYLK